MSVRSRRARSPVSWIVAVLALFVCPPLALAAEPPPPRLVVDARGISLAGLPRVLDDPEIRRQLDSGLTTTFSVRVLGRSGALTVEGGGRVEVRYEPWDEIYELAAIGVDLRPVRATLDSFEALRARWNELRLYVAPASMAASWRRSGVRLRVDLEVIPFSRQEQEEAQRWFSKSLDGADAAGSAEEAGAASEERSEALGEVLDLLLATSIQRRPLVAWRWTVMPVTQSPPPPGRAP
ncbi:MAG: hypothetical protein AAGC60_08480 [Acidobacteriota bacterium]